jgi:hypothetical protein
MPVPTSLRAMSIAPSTHVRPCRSAGTTDSTGLTFHAPTGDRCQQRHNSAFLDLRVYNCISNNDSPLPHFCTRCTSHLSHISVLSEAISAPFISQFLQGNGCKRNQLLNISLTASVVQRSQLLAADPEVPALIPSTTRFSE